MKIYLKFSLLFIFILSANSYAFSWQDLWQTKDRQAQKLMGNGDYAKAKSIFTDNDWRAAASYKAKDYAGAADLYAKSNTESSDYNYGNALAFLGKLQQAIDAYDKAIAKDPRDEDAIYNRKIVQEMLKEQQKKNQENKETQPNQDNQNQDNKDNSENKADKEDKKENKQNKDNKSKSSQNKKQNQQPQAQKEEEKLQKDSSASDKQQMKDQWLRLIPDDPGGLLREKFRRDYLRRQSGSD